MMAKTVAVVGAGISGLATGKSMLEAGLVPTIFDKRPRLGGMWDPEAKRCWDSLQTNLSRFTCCFSDFPWKPNTQLFPTQREVREYLDDYAKHFNLEKHFSYDSEVTKVLPLGDGADGRQWQVEWSTEGGKSHQSKVFDYVVIASGFFNAPYIPPIEGLDTFKGKQIHSQEYRNAQGFEGQRTVVVGASFTGVEIASEVADVSKQCVHAMKHPFFVLSRLLPIPGPNPAPPFLPADFVLYRRSSHPPIGEIQILSPEFCGMFNGLYGALCGPQGPISPAAGSTGQPFGAVHEAYPKQLKKGLIDIEHGKVTKVNGNTVIFDNGKVIHDVDNLVFCTGYVPKLDFLSQETLNEVEYDTADSFQPLLLHGNVFHPNVPNLAFVGMYRGVYFTTQELQARWAANVFSGKLPTPTAEAQKAGIEKERIIRNQNPRGQVPHGDYMGYCDYLAAEAGVMPTAEFIKAHDVLAPPHFRTGADTDAAVADLEAVEMAHFMGKMVAYVVTRELEGEWKLEREIVDRKGDTSGKVVGTAKFAHASKTTPALLASRDLLYTENGKFTTKTGEFDVCQKYIYAYDAKADEIQVFFEKDAAKGNLFETIRILPNAPGTQAPGWRAEATHECEKDTYKSSYLFTFQGPNISKVEIVHEVTGSNKDYTSTTHLVPLI